MRLVQAMYANARSWVCVGEGFSEEFEVKVGVHQGSVLSLLLLLCGAGLDLLQSSGEYPCAVCRTGVRNNSIYCNGCKLWVHKKCSGLQ